jgi:superfamily I DNA/RNA helicase
MQPTEEQQAVLDAKSRVINVNARAGTGKTTTLLFLAGLYPEARILYLVFNRKARDEAARKFPANVQAHTLHSLAFRHEGFRWKDNIGNFTPAHLLPAFEGTADAQQLASLAHQFLTFFLNSPLERLEDGTEPFMAELAQTPAQLFESQTDRIVGAARELATAWNRREMECPHDFYLKLFHKSGAFLRALDQYDLVLVDEGQDLSWVVLDALRRCRRPIVLVGDTHQRIYGFRYAVDAMRRLPSGESLDLTLSFRFGAPVADLATSFIQEAKRDGRFLVRGHPDVESRVRIAGEPPKNKCAILSRKNFSLFTNAVELRQAGASFCFERDIAGVLGRVLDVFYLLNEQRNKVRDDFIRSFRSMQHLDDYVEATDDFQLKGMAQIVRRYQSEFPGIVFEMMKENRATTESGNPDAVVLSTVHASKGQEYRTVQVDADVAETLANAENHGSPETFLDEVNLAYVAFTRASHHLRVPLGFLEVLTVEWNDTLRRLEYFGSTKRKSRMRKRSEKHRRMAPGQARAAKNGKKARRRGLGGGASHECDESGEATEDFWPVGSRVMTAHGPGRIVQVEGTRCLVDLESQQGRVWENRGQLAEPERT